LALLSAIRRVHRPTVTCPSDSDPASAYSLFIQADPCRSSSFLCSSIIDSAMQFNAQPAVSDPRFAPNTNHASPQTIDNNPSAVSATRDHVDIDHQCGVPLFNGVPCPALLSCPLHSLQDKQFVPGRTAPLEHLMARQQQSLTQSTRQ
jgi:hypothetical protein